MRKHEIKPSLRDIFKKLSKKDKEAYEQILNKTKEIINCEDPEHYKNLRNPLQLFKSVHIKKSFVLVFSYDKQKDFLYFTDYDHHDNIYRKKPEWYSLVKDLNNFLAALLVILKFLYRI